MITESAVLVRKEEVIYCKYVTVDEVPLLTYLLKEVPLLCNLQAGILYRELAVESAHILAIH